MSKQKTRRLEVHLGYFKQGDDLNNYLKPNVTAFEAFKLHAQQMRDVAGHLDLVAEACEGEDVKVDADVHCIWMECSEKLAKKLVKAGLAEFDEFEEEE